MSMTAAGCPSAALKFTRRPSARTWTRQSPMVYSTTWSRTSRTRSPARWFRAGRSISQSKWPELAMIAPSRMSLKCSARMTWMSPVAVIKMSPQGAASPMVITRLPSMSASRARTWSTSTTATCAPRPRKARTRPEGAGVGFVLCGVWKAASGVRQPRLESEDSAAGLIDSRFFDLAGSNRVGQRPDNLVRPVVAVRHGAGQVADEHEVYPRVDGDDCPLRDAEHVPDLPHLHWIRDDDAVVAQLGSQQAGDDLLRKAGRAVRIEQRVCIPRGQHGVRQAFRDERPERLEFVR